MDSGTDVAPTLGPKGVFLVASVLGITGFWIAILADTSATVLVTLNALCLLAYDASWGPENRTRYRRQSDTSQPRAPRVDCGAKLPVPHKELHSHLKAL